MIGGRYVAARVWSRRDLNPGPPPYKGGAVSA
ncbi:hypothetical protein APE_1409a [Aeropyrum pernix K1]|uniref:Uncharacterized protein n=1 Tax=Aeropyrum pernix (strain ATCC 700893 / DSM 11879 / JCM 9820 / NBRC 100138 / K1) TaxID=272557 RepID=Q05E12_AERPE|nr:hypothetical protein APE_1409a [Aeropyrum pernix K1]